MKPLDIHYVTMTSYDETFKNVKVVFRKDDLSKTLGEVLESRIKKPDTHCRNRKISACYLLLLGRPRKRIY
jgi:bisphosphoglycerate-independent phosphoglycerate mutase (AlkP superfamily)